MQYMFAGMPDTRSGNFETGLPGRMIPIPSEVSAGCGLAWCVPAEERGALLDALESGGLAYEAVHEVELY